MEEDDVRVSKMKIEHVVEGLKAKTKDYDED